MDLSEKAPGRTRSIRSQEVVAVMTTAGGVLASAHWAPVPWWPIFPLFWLLLWGVVIFAIFRFVRGGRWHRSHTAQAVLAERYARGEISVEEYRERLSVLEKRGS